MGVDSTGGGPERKCRVFLFGLVDRGARSSVPVRVSVGSSWGGQGDSQASTQAKATVCATLSRRKCQKSNLGN